MIVGVDSGNLQYRIFLSPVNEYRKEAGGPHVALRLVAELSSSLSLSSPMQFYEMPPFLPSTLFAFPAGGGESRFSGIRFAEQNVITVLKLEGEC